MQVETLTRICPLCRRAAEGEAAPPSTRLCRDCRAMLDPILPRPGLVQPDYAVALAGSPVTVAAPLAVEADFDDLSFAPVAGAADDFARVNHSLDDDFPARPSTPADLSGRAFARQAEPLVPAAFLAPDLDEDPEVFLAPDQYEDDDIGPALEPARPDLAMVPPALSDRAALTGEIEWPEAARPGLESRAAFAMPVADPDQHGLAVEEAPPPAVSADPWEDPLPAWEYSQNEWPLLIQKQEPTVGSKLKWPLVALALLAAVGAATYFFFLKPRATAPAAPAAHEASPQPQLTVPVNPAPAAPPAATTGTEATPAAAADKKDAPPLASVNPATDNQGKHTLQVMASTNEGEANGFAERLKNAAIPAYVVRADRGGQGIWYRVRIGRFATPDEAQRFAAEVRSRARAAGVTLKDLQVTSYDKP